MIEVTFADLGVSQVVSGALARAGAVTPFPVQALVIPDGLAGRDVLARSRTGSGKTIAFAVPIVERLEPGSSRPGALVLVPTRELAVQVVRAVTPLAKARGLRAAAAYGGVGIREQAKAVRAADVLVATPGRLDDLLRRRMVDLSSVQILVLDEADRMLDMGFLPDVDAIVRRLPDDRQTLFLSATLDGEVDRLARRYTRSPVRHEVGAGRPTVEEAEHLFVPVGTDGKVTALAKLLRSEHGRTLVFVRTKRGADRLVARLKAHGIAAEPMHGDLTQGRREAALRRFESGKVKTLVATDVAARGLDVAGIDRVVNYDPPEDDKSYVHRVGRTARAGRTGVGVTLVSQDQEADVSRMAARLKLEEDFASGGMKVAPPRLVYASRKGRRSLLHGGAHRRR
jgi:superfamily II DNA/RNA helicase